ncbi:hypothetical protein HDV00_003453 [Rhizophlyctis rosea]|nr:hypothetical protein HDV00_003453 [Rhizophlyctis rosea]
MFDPPPILLCGHVEVEWMQNNMVGTSATLREMKDVARIEVEFEGQERERHPKTLGARKDIWNEKVTVWEPPSSRSESRNSIHGDGAESDAEAVETYDGPGDNLVRNAIHGDFKFGQV